MEVDRGWWLTLKDLTVRPGPTIEAYLNGNTKRYFSPVKYLLLISALFYLVISIEQTFDPTSDPVTVETWSTKLLSTEIPPFSKASAIQIVGMFPLVLNGNMVLYFLVMLPFAAFAGTFFFRSLNFTEILITWIYLWSQLLYYILLVSILPTSFEQLGTNPQIVFLILTPLLGFGMFYFITKTFRHLTHGKWFLTFIKVFFSMYGGFFTFFGTVWLLLGLVKVIFTLL